MPMFGKKLLMYPFTTMGGASTPDQFRQALGYIEFLWTTEGMYKSAMRRMISFNVTSLRVSDAEGKGELSRQSRTAIDNVLNPILEDMQVLISAGEDLMCYGNAFRTLVYPSIRIMICPSCKSEFLLEYMLRSENRHMFNARYSLKTLEQAQSNRLATLGMFTCPRCAYRGAWFVQDRETDLKDGIKVLAWRPQDILIETGAFDRVSNRYHLRINAVDKRYIEEGHPLTVTTWPIEIMYAVKLNKTFCFNKDAIFHLREKTLSGLQTFGWGIPRALAHFKLVWYVAALYKLNEALTIDYTIPKRVITPDVRGAADGPTADPSNMSDFMPIMQQLRRMWTTNDAGSVEFLPFPIKYQLLGGEAKQLVPDTLISAAEDALLNAMDIPSEMYRATLQMEATPLAMSVVENTWRPLRWSLNSFLEWINKQMSVRLQWESVKLMLRPLKLAADMERQVWLSQLAAQDTVSWTSALDPAEMDYLEEQRRVADDKFAVQKLQQEMQDKLEQSSLVKNISKSQNPAAVGQQPPPQGGDPSQQGAAPTGGANQTQGAMPTGSANQMQTAAQMALSGQGSIKDWQSVTPQDMLTYAQTIAQQVAYMEASTRRQMLAQLRDSEPRNVYDAILGEVERLDRQARTQGAAMLKSQMAQGGA
jgi:DNA-directed RNA polymerase subunit M/transcription elongation factor TFIIS